MGKVRNFNQSEARKNCFLVSEWLKFGTLSQNTELNLRQKREVGIRHFDYDIVILMVERLRSFIKFSEFLIAAPKSDAIPCCCIVR